MVERETVNYCLWPVLLEFEGASDLLEGLLGTQIARLPARVSDSVDLG